MPISATGERLPYKPTGQTGSAPGSPPNTQMEEALKKALGKKAGAANTTARAAVPRVGRPRKGGSASAGVTRRKGGGKGGSRGMPARGVAPAITDPSRPASTGPPLNEGDPRRFAAPPGPPPGGPPGQPPMGGGMRPPGPPRPGGPPGGGDIQTMLRAAQSPIPGVNRGVRRPGRPV